MDCTETDDGSRSEANILTINTGSTSTKVGYYSHATCLFHSKIEHSTDDLAHFPSVMDQHELRHRAVRDFLDAKKIPLADIDIVMARGGLITPVITGVYEVNADMREVLGDGRDGIHACNLSAILADDIAEEVNEARVSAENSFRRCRAYIADPPMADEMLEECRVGGVPEFSRKTLFHALNSRAVVRRYIRERGPMPPHRGLIVAHMGGGVTVSLHRGGRVIDTTHGLGGDGPITPERAGCCPPFELIDLCFSGKYSKEQIRRRLVGGGGAVAYFGTSNMVEVQRLSDEGNRTAGLFLKAFVLNISKYIAALAATADGKVDAIILTGGIAHNGRLTESIARKCAFIAPVVVYPGEDELKSLAEYGRMILAGKTQIHTYHKDKLSSL